MYLSAELDLFRLVEIGGECALPQSGPGADELLTGAREFRLLQNESMLWGNCRAGQTHEEIQKCSALSIGP